jgi:hypothetical protein
VLLKNRPQPVAFAPKIGSVAMGHPGSTNPAYGIKVTPANGASLPSDGVRCPGGFTMSSMTTDWQAWHRAYDDPGSSLSRRLSAVQHEIAIGLDEAASGPISLLSLCAGDGRDVLGVLSAHPRSGDVRASLIDIDDELIAAARLRARALGLAKVECVMADAGSSATFAKVLPVDVVVACGIFGNISRADISATISALAAMLTPNGTAIWTRHRREPDLTPWIRRRFSECGFAERSFVAVPDSLASVGRHRLTGPADATGVPASLFEFEGDGVDANV